MSPQQEVYCTSRAQQRWCMPDETLVLTTVQWLEVVSYYLSDEMIETALLEGS